MIRFEDLIGVDYNWWNLLILILVMASLYFMLRIASRIVANMDIRTGVRQSLKKYLDLAILVFEPLTVLLIVSVFVMIRPAMHGIMLLILGTAGYEHVRNYIHSRIVILDKSIQKGKRIKIAGKQGIITHLGRLGIQVRNDEGLNYIPYHRLVKSGFVLTSGEKIGGYYQLQIQRPEGGSEGPQAVEQLADILYSSPYLDGEHKPEIPTAFDGSGGMEIKLLVKEESHIRDLISLLRERGYDTTLL